MRLLFVHANFPAQFRRLVPWLANLGHDIIFIAENREWHAPSAEGIRIQRYKPHRSGGSEYLHPYLRRFDSAVLTGQAVYRACREISSKGWTPDWVINHVGFGCGFYLRDAFPNARRAALFEWYYNSYGSDVEFLQKGQVGPDRQMRLRTWNAHILLELADVDIAVTPTSWQQSQFPKHLRSSLKVIHEGIDWQEFSRLRLSRPAQPPCLDGKENCEVVTYVSRGFEDYRGFPQAMQAFAELQRRRPNVQILIAGSDVVAYGAERTDGRSWGQWARQEAGLDSERTHWLGALQTNEYQQLLAWSDVHLYLTVPFVLSWSLIEAMAAGCSIVASDTEPVREVISDRDNGLLVDFFDVQAQVKAIEILLNNERLAFSLGQAAQKASSKFSADAGLDAWSQLLSLSQH